MNDMMTTSGLVATEPRRTVTSEGLAITSFRLAASYRKFNRAKQEWEYGETNWYTVSAFRQLAANLAISLAKGDRVVVTGRLRIRQWQNNEKKGTQVDIDADAVGHDLNWGTSKFTRTMTARSLTGSAGDRTGDPMSDSGTSDSGRSDSQMPESDAGIGFDDESIAPGPGGWALDEAEPLVSTT
ncbi:MAG: single-stranded DNA-binding protein [Microbacteriaceae bacterium]